MITGGSLAMLVMSRMPSNYGWREAQEEEIDGALRVSFPHLPLHGDRSGIALGWGLG